jgi:peptidoglycan hydrolase-like protein with peptidoglycan-binding domain
MVRAVGTAVFQDRRRPEADRLPPTVVRRPSADGVDGTDVALPVGLMDGGARERYALSLQRTAGNRAMTRVARRTAQREVDTGEVAPNPYATTEKGGGAKTELPANPYVGENDPVTLSNARFVGIPGLAKIAAGGPPLSKSDNGKAVKAVQGALISVGFELVQHEKDGDFGPETATAIKLFRSRRGIPGTDLTARALGELDQTAPGPGKTEEHYFEYERLFADGYLDATIAIGFDEGEMQQHIESLKQARAWIQARGFTPMKPEPGKPEEFHLRRMVTYPTKSGDRTTREIIVRLKLIPAGSGAKAQYAKALKEDEIAIYSGHARRGIGPDFDKDKSATENFVIGVASALHAAGRAVPPSKVEQSHYVFDKKNDLEAMTKAGDFDKEKYRIWLFEACTTIAYFDELRGGILPDPVDRTNLDLMGTRLPAPLITEMQSSLAMLDGILAAKTIEQITTEMDRAGDAFLAALSGITPSDIAEIKKMTTNLHVHEGAGDNPIAPSP